MLGIQRDAGHQSGGARRLVQDYGEKDLSPQEKKRIGGGGGGNCFKCVRRANDKCSM